MKGDRKGVGARERKDANARQAAFLTAWKPVDNLLGRYRVHGTVLKWTSKV
jgi:hypothetical protein